ncbi:MAG: hypothetical protein AVDCRST_MAG64-609, partial [uncultured Phycisphaerae bacterium]
ETLHPWRIGFRFGRVALLGPRGGGGERAAGPRVDHPGGRQLRLGRLRPGRHVGRLQRLRQRAGQRGVRRRRPARRGQPELAAVREAGRRVRRRVRRGLRKRRRPAARLRGGSQRVRPDVRGARLADEGDVRRVGRARRHRLDHRLADERGHRGRRARAGAARRERRTCDRALVGADAGQVRAARDGQRDRGAGGREHGLLHRQPEPLAGRRRPERHARPAAAGGVERRRHARRRR